MKKSLKRILSFVLATATALSAMATTMQRLSTTPPAADRLHTAAAVKAPAKMPDTKRPALLPKVRKATMPSADVFRRAARKPASVHPPYKVGYKAENAMPEFLGSVLYSTGWTSDSEPIGLYSVPTASGANFELKALGPNAQFGGALVGETYYTCELEIINNTYISAITFLGYDINTGAIVYEQASNAYVMTMTCDVNTGTVYGIGQSNELVKIIFNMDEVILQNVASLSGANEMGLWNSIACDSKGELWGILGNYTYDEYYGDYSCISSNLYKIDKATGACTNIGATGYDCEYSSDCTFDATDRLFWAISPSTGEGYLAQVNTTTGAATVINTFAGAEQVTGLVIPRPTADDKAPAAVENLKATFEGASLSGKISFTAPTTLFDGTAASGELTYKITSAAENIATGTTTFGAVVEEDITVEAAGLYTYTVTVSNSAGASPGSNIKVYVGADTPEATTVEAKYDNGVATITWFPVTGTVNGGYINPEAVTYTVTRYPGAVEVAKDITATTVTETIEEPEEITTYYYEVVATADGLSSEPAKSNLMIIGSIVPPFSASFDNDACGFTIVDANGDGKTWMNQDGRMYGVYNSSKAMDDWLITPPLRLEKGKVYDMSVDLGAYLAAYPERVEIKMGKAADPAAMTTTLLEAITLDNPISNDPLTWPTKIVPEEDGVYFIGIHGISDADKYYVCVDNFTISAPKSSDAPGMAQDLVVVPDSKGALSALVSFKTPTRTVDGQTLESLTKVELRRGNTLLNTWESPAIGKDLLYTDTDIEKEGTYTYTVVAYNEAGNGAEAGFSAFIGVDLPGAVSNVVAAQTANPGEVTISWDAVTTSQAGLPMDASIIKYQVYKFEGSTVAAVSSPIADTEYTYQAVPAGEQDFVQYCVYAVTSRGEGAGAVSNFIAAGTPYTSFHISVRADLQTYIVGINEYGGASWGNYSDATGIPSQDGDDFFLGAEGSFKDDYGTLFTGLLSLTEIENPCITFYTFNLGLTDTYGNPVVDNNLIEVSVLENGSTDLTVVKSVRVNEVAETDQWGRVLVDLSAYKGKIIQVYFTVQCSGSLYTFLDNITLGSMAAHDLAAKAIQAPSMVKAGSDYTVSVTIENEGSEKSGEYTLELYADDTLLDSKTCPALEASKTTVEEFTLTMSPLAAETVTYYAKVVYAADENVDNNLTSTITVTPVISALPAPSYLKGTADNGVTLTWTAADLTKVPNEPVTEDFEDATSFASKYGDWVFVDLDKASVGGFNDLNVPGITPGSTKGSFWIWDNATANDSYNTFAAHSGSKFLFAFYRADYKATDDWAISPELDGSSQLISFYAKSYSATYPEKIEIYYSTGSTNPTDFVKIEGVGGSVPGTWTLYEAKVPEGAKRFAIRSCAENSFMLMVDDATFVPAEGKKMELTLLGYNVYRNGVKINDAPVEGTTFTDSNVETGANYTYVVTAVYATGESSASNSVEVIDGQVGLDSIYTSSVTVATGRHTIIVTGAEGMDVAVYAVDGKTLYAGLGEAYMTIPASQGIYVVKTGTIVTKVLVK